jgi:hypothetical protein
MDDEMDEMSIWLDDKMDEMLVRLDDRTTSGEAFDVFYNI